MRRGKFFVSMIAGLLLVGLAAGCGSSSDDSDSGSSSTDTVKIGLIDALSGSAASFGIGDLHGAQLAVKQINADGGIKGLDGAKLKLETYDLQSNPALASGLAQRAVDDGVAAVVGSSISDAVIAGTNVTQRAGIPWINSGALADKITDRGYDSVFATQGSAAQVSEVQVQAFQDLGEQLGHPIKTVGVAYIGLAYGQELFEDFKQSAEGKIDIVASTSYPADTTDFGSIATSIASKNPDMVYSIGYSPDSIAFGKALGATSAKPVFAYFQGLPPATAVEEAKGISDTWSMRLDIRKEYNLDSKSFKDFFNGYKKEFGIQPENVAETSYTAVMAIRQALDEAKSTDPEDLTAALKNVELTGQNGNVFAKDSVKFNDQGLIEDPPVGLVQIQNGKIETIWPENVATADVVPYGG